MGREKVERDVHPYFKPGDQVIAIYCTQYRRRGEMPVSISLDPREDTQEYRLTLNLRDAIATVECTKDGVTYTRGKECLQWTCPIMRGSAELFLDMLITDPKTGWLVTAPSNLPENTFICGDGKRVCMGPTMDMQILRELFGNCIEAATILGIDKDFRARLAKARAKLAPNQIGKHGQIQEWLEDYEEAAPHHRQVSHLYRLRPSVRQTSPRAADRGRSSPGRAPSSTAPAPDTRDGIGSMRGIMPTPVSRCRSRSNPSTPVFARLHGLASPRVLLLVLPRG